MSLFRRNRHFSGPLDRPDLMFSDPWNVQIGPQIIRNRGSPPLKMLKSLKSGPESSGTPKIVKKVTFFKKAQNRQKHAFCRNRRFLQK